MTRHYFTGRGGPTKPLVTFTTLDITDLLTTSSSSSSLLPSPSGPPSRSPRLLLPPRPEGKRIVKTGGVVEEISYQLPVLLLAPPVPPPGPVILFLTAGLSWPSTARSPTYLLNIVTTEERRQQRSIFSPQTFLSLVQRSLLGGQLSLQVVPEVRQHHCHPLI